MTATEPAGRLRLARRPPAQESKIGSRRRTAAADIDSIDLPGGRDTRCPVSGSRSRYADGSVYLDLFLWPLRPSLPPFPLPPAPQPGDSAGRGYGLRQEAAGTHPPPVYQGGRRFSAGRKGPPVPAGRRRRRRSQCDPAISSSSLAALHLRAFARDIVAVPLPTRRFPGLTMVDERRSHFHAAMKFPRCAATALIRSTAASCGAAAAASRPAKAANRKAVGFPFTTLSSCPLCAGFSHCNTGFFRLCRKAAPWPKQGIFWWRRWQPIARGTERQNGPRRHGFAESPAAAGTIRFYERYGMGT